MEKTVYIVGTRHRFQGWRKWNRTAPKRHLDQFAAFLEGKIHDYHIQSIAEEMNLEALLKLPHPELPSGKSVPCLIAEALRLPHKYCDPDSARRKALGIPDSEEDEAENNKQREAEWLRQLQQFQPFPCLFVLGSTHSDTFPDLLKKESDFRKRESA